MVKKISLVVLGLFLTTLVWGRDFDYVDGIAAVVDGQAITFLAVRQQLDRMRRGNPQEFARLEREEGRNGLYRRATDELIENALIMAEVARREITLPRELVDGRIQMIVNDQAGGDWTRFSDLLLDGGQDMVEFRKEVEKRLAAEILVDELVRRAVSVTPGEVARFFAENREQFTRPERARLGLIYLIRGDGETDEQLAKREAEVRRRLLAGDDFAAIAKEFSGDATAASGGDLGWQRVDDLGERYRGALANVAPGELAPTIRDPNGFHILRVMAYEGAGELTLDEGVRHGVEQFLRRQRERERYERFVGELRRKFYVRNFIGDEIVASEKN